jgi:hypothetical protein
MSRLAALSNKNPKEVAKLLGIVSRSLLPSPGVGEVILESGTNQEFAEAVLKEIRDTLHISKEDFSMQTQSKIFSFLSEEMSAATLNEANLREIRNRLAKKGDLHPSQYEVKVYENPSSILALGERESHLIEAVKHPDNVIHLESKYVSEELAMYFTISTKLVIPQRIEDKFLLIVISLRKNNIQQVLTGVRIYDSEISLDAIVDPLDALKKFMNTYGFTIKAGDAVSKLILNELVKVDDSLLHIQPEDIIRSIEGDGDARCLSFGILTASRFRGANNETVIELVLGFLINIEKYFITFQEHNHIPQVKVRSFRRLKEFAL